MRPTDRREQGWGSWEALFHFLSGERRDGGCAGCATCRQAVWGGRRRGRAVGRWVGRPAGADEISCLCRKRRSFPPDRRRGAPSLHSRFAPSLPCCHPQSNLTSRLSRRDRGTNAQHFAVSLIPPIRDEKGDSVRKRKLRLAE